MRLRWFGHTDVGQRREHNEDAFLADPELGLFVVCDGVGGRARGEIASSEAVGLIWEWVKRDETLIRNQEFDASEATGKRFGGTIRGAIQNATYMLNAMGEVNPDQRGMSTTASVLLLTQALAVVGQVGDSRLYLMRGAAISQVTEDHTLINYQLKHGLITPEEAKRSRVKNVITRAVGHKDYVEVDTIALPILAGDKFLLCSDGLHGYLEQEDDVRSIMERDVQSGVLHAIRFANERGGSDNITAMMVELL